MKAPSQESMLCPETPRKSVWLGPGCVLSGETSQRAGSRQRWPHGLREGVPIYSRWEGSLWWGLNTGMMPPKGKFRNTALAALWLVDRGEGVCVDLSVCPTPTLHAPLLLSQPSSLPFPCWLLNPWSWEILEGGSIYSCLLPCGVTLGGLRPVLKVPVPLTGPSLHNALHLLMATAPSPHASLWQEVRPVY